MKNLKMYLMVACIAIAVALTGCQGKMEKITDIPVTTKSEEAKATMRQGLALLDAGDVEKAKTFFTKAIEQDPKLAVAYMFRAGTNQVPKEFTDDLNSAKANLEGASDWEKMYYEFNSTFLNDDWNKRLEIAQKIATANPDAARAQVDLGNTYWTGNQDAKARECFQKAVAMNPKWVGGFSALTNSYLFNEPKDFKKAEESALKAVELAPQSPGAAIALGDCYRAQKDLEKARDAYGKAIQLDPNVSGAYYKKGHANTFLGNYDEARQNYMEGGKHDETKVTSIQLTAFTWLYEGDYQKALTYLGEQTAALDASGESKDKIAVSKMNSLGNCANIALHSNDLAKLKEIISMMEPVSIEMGNQVGTEEAKLQQKAGILYWQSIAMTMEGNYDAAKAKAEEVKSTLEPVKEPNKLNGYEFALGFIAMHQKNYPDAVNHFEKTYQPSVYNRYWLAMADDAAGNKDKANVIFKEISDFNFNGIDYALIRKQVKAKVASL